MAGLTRQRLLAVPVELPTLVKALSHDDALLGALHAPTAHLAFQADELCLDARGLEAVAAHVAAGEARLAAGLSSVRAPGGTLQHHAMAALRLPPSTSPYMARYRLMQALFYLLGRGKVHLHACVLGLTKDLGEADVQGQVAWVTMEVVGSLETYAATGVSDIVHASLGSTLTQPLERAITGQASQLHMYAMCAVSLEPDSAPWVAATWYSLTLLARSAQAITAANNADSLDALQDTHVVSLLPSALPAMAALTHNAAFAGAVAPFAGALVSALLHLLLRGGAGQAALQHLVSTAWRFAAVNTASSTSSTSSRTSDDPTASGGPAAAFAGVAHPLAALAAAAVSLAGHCARGCVAGVRVSEEEAQLAPWVGLGILSGGVAAPALAEREAAAPGAALPPFKEQASTVQTAIASSVEGLQAAFKAGVDVPTAVAQSSPADMARAALGAAEVGVAAPQPDPAKEFVCSLFQYTSVPRRGGQASFRRSYSRVREAPSVVAAARAAAPQPDVLAAAPGGGVLTEVATAAEAYCPTPRGKALRGWLGAAKPLKGALKRRHGHDRYEHAEVLLLASSLLASAWHQAPDTPHSESKGEEELPLWLEAKQAVEGESTPRPSERMLEVWDSVVAFRRLLGDMATGFASAEPHPTGDAPPVSPGASKAAAGAAAGGGGAAAPSAAPPSLTRRPSGLAPRPGRERRGTRGPRELEVRAPGGFQDLYDGVIRRLGFLAGGYVYTCVAGDCLSPVEAEQAKALHWRAPPSTAYASPHMTPPPGFSTPHHDSAAGDSIEELAAAGSVASADAVSDLLPRAQLGVSTKGAPGGEAAVGVAFAPVWVAAQLQPAMAPSTVQSVSAASEAAAGACLAPPATLPLPHSFPWAHKSLEQAARAGAILPPAHPDAHSTKHKFNPLAVSLRAVSMYALEGWAAPPEVLAGVLVAQRCRAQQRIFGLRALGTLLDTAQEAGASVAAALTAAGEDAPPAVALRQLVPVRAGSPRRTPAQHGEAVRDWLRCIVLGDLRSALRGVREAQLAAGIEATTGRSVAAVSGLAAAAASGRLGRVGQASGDEDGDGDVAIGSDDEEEGDMLPASSLPAAADALALPGGAWGGGQGDMWPLGATLTSGSAYGPGPAADKSLQQTVHGQEAEGGGALVESDDQHHQCATWSVSHAAPGGLRALPALPPALVAAFGTRHHPLTNVAAVGGSLREALAAAVQGLFAHLGSVLVKAADTRAPLPLVRATLLPWLVHWDPASPLDMEVLEEGGLLQSLAPAADPAPSPACLAPWTQVAGGGEGAWHAHPPALLRAAVAAGQLCPLQVLQYTARGARERMVPPPSAVVRAASAVAGQPLASPHDAVAHVLHGSLRPHALPWLDAETALLAYTELLGTPGVLLPVEAAKVLEGAALVSSSGWGSLASALLPSVGACAGAVQASLGSAWRLLWTVHVASTELRGGLRLAGDATPFSAAADAEQQLLGDMLRRTARAALAWRHLGHLDQPAAGALPVPATCPSGSWGALASLVFEDMPSPAPEGAEELVGSVSGPSPVHASAFVAGAQSTLASLSSLLADAAVPSARHGGGVLVGDVDPLTRRLVRCKHALLALLALVTDADGQTRCLALQGLAQVLPFHDPGEAAGVLAVVRNQAGIGTLQTARGNPTGVAALLLRVAARGTPLALDSPAGCGDAVAAVGTANTAVAASAIACDVLRLLLAFPAWAPAVREGLLAALNHGTAEEAGGAMAVLGGGTPGLAPGLRFVITAPASTVNGGAGAAGGEEGGLEGGEAGDPLSHVLGAEPLECGRTRRAQGTIIATSPSSSHALVMLGPGATGEAGVVSQAGSQPLAGFLSPATQAVQDDSCDTTPVPPPGASWGAVPVRGEPVWLPRHRLAAVPRTSPAWALGHSLDTAQDSLLHSALPALAVALSQARAPHPDALSRAQSLLLANSAGSVLLLGCSAFPAAAGLLAQRPGLLPCLAHFAQAPPHTITAGLGFLPAGSPSLHAAVLEVWCRATESGGVLPPRHATTAVAPLAGLTQATAAAVVLHAAVGSGQPAIPAPASSAASALRLGSEGRAPHVSLPDILVKGGEVAARLSHWITLSLPEEVAMAAPAVDVVAAPGDASTGSTLAGSATLWPLAFNVLAPATGRSVSEAVAALSVTGSSLPHAWLWLQTHDRASPQLRAALAALHLPEPGAGAGSGTALSRRHTVDPARPSAGASSGPDAEAPMSSAVEGINLGRPLITGRDFVASRGSRMGAGGPPTSREQPGEGASVETYLPSAATRMAALQLQGVQPALSPSAAATAGALLLPLAAFDVAAPLSTGSVAAASQAMTVSAGATAAQSGMVSLAPAGAVVVVVPPPPHGPATLHCSSPDATPGAAAGIAAAALHATAGTVGTLSAPASHAAAVAAWEAAATTAGPTQAVHAACELGLGTAREGRSSWRDMAAVDVPGQGTILVPRAWVYLAVGGYGADLSVVGMDAAPSEALVSGALASLGAPATRATMQSALVSAVHCAAFQRQGGAGDGLGWLPCLAGLALDGLGDATRRLLLTLLASDAGSSITLAHLGGAQSLLSLLRLLGASEAAAGVAVPVDTDAAGDVGLQGLGGDATSGRAATAVLTSTVTRLLASEPVDGGPLLVALVGEVNKHLSIMSHQAQAVAAATQDVQSAHPAHEDSAGAVCLPGARAMWVMFDPNTCTNPAEPEANLTFYADAAHTEVLARFRGGHYAFVPFLAHTPDGVLYYKHTVGSSGAARGRRRVGDQYWGFRCTVRAVNNIAWAGVGQQASSPSFLWGCWVLEMLAEVALPRSQLDRGAVHNGDIVNILLNYLATPRAPHKPHVIGLLTRLFSVPMHFDLQRRPPMERVTAHLGSVVGEVTKKASSMAAAFLPLPALQANELVSTGIGAAFMLDDKWSAFTPIASLTPTPLLQAGLTTSDRATLSGGVTSLAGDDAEWFPPMGVAQGVLEDPSTQVYALEGLPGLTAMAYAREVLKSLATASRIPDLWVLRAAELAHDGGAARGGGRRVQGRPNLQLTTNSLVSIQRAMVLISGGHIANVHGLSLQPTASGRLPHCLAHIGTPAGTCLSPSHPQFASLIGEVDVELVEWMRMRASKTEIRLRELEVWNLQLAPGDERTYPALTLLDTATLRLRAALLIILNTLVNRCLKLVDTSGSAGPWSTGALLRTVSHLIFAETKGELLNAAINRTSTYEDSGVAITLDNELATASKEEGRADVMNSTCIFAQMFRELRHHRAARLRSSLDSKDRMFKVALAGEPGIDWGGIYRDCITRAVNDLFAAPQSNINLFTVVGSAAEADDDVWVPNLALLMRPPSEVPEAAEHTGAEEDATPIVRALAMWRFVGILMGLSWRTRAWLDFTLAPLVWKSLCGEELDLSDLCHVDPALHASLGRMAAMLRGVEGQPDASAEAVPGWDTHFASQMFVYRSPWRRGGASGGERVGEELLPSGATTPVTPANAKQYMALAMQQAFAPLKRPLAAIRSGLLSIVPGRAVQLCRWSDLHTLVCGPSDIDQDMLMKHTKYGTPYSLEHPVVKRFWRVFEGMTPRERSRLVRYAWGRSKLPRGEAGWITREGKVVFFLLYPFYKDANNNTMRGDESLVESHSCFFQLKVPQYTSDEVMRRRLLDSVEHGLSTGSFMLA